MHLANEGCSPQRGEMSTRKRKKRSNKGKTKQSGFPAREEMVGEYVIRLYSRVRCHFRIRQ